MSPRQIPLLLSLCALACGPADPAPTTDGEDTGAFDTGLSLPQIVPLYDGDTERQPDTWFERDGAIVTRFGDRGRDRHAREDQFQSYDHYLPHYWTHRTSRFQFVDTVASGGGTIEISFVSE